jgi:transposase InsO family protein
LSIRYSERLAEVKAQPSVGSVGYSYDNALAETIIGLYKTEVIHRRGPWRIWRLWNTPRSNGSTGSIIVDCWSR